MNTPSHFLINYALARLLRVPKKLNSKMSAVLWGSIAPDLLLYVFSIGAFLYFMLFEGMRFQEANQYIFDDLFFNNIWWIITHNFLQAPFIILGGALITGIIIKRPQQFQARTLRFNRWLFVFFLSCALHVLIDILTHHDDGPLLLYPFNFTVRFSSPVSYWDGNHYGDIFFRFEMGLNIVLIIYLITTTIIHKSKKRKESRVHP